MLRHLSACIVTLLLLCSPARADGEYSALRVFGIDEIRLGGMKHNLESNRGKSGVGFSFCARGWLRRQCRGAVQLALAEA